MSLQFRTRLASGQLPLDADLRDLLAVSGATGTYLYAATGRNGGISVFDLTTGGGEVREVTYFQPLSAGPASTRLEIATSGDGAVLFSGTTGTGAILTYRLDPDGGFGAAGEVTYAGAALDVWTLGEDGAGDPRLYAADAISGRILAFDAIGAGSDQVVPDEEAFAGDQGVQLMAALSLDQGPVLIVVESGALPGAVSYRVAAADGRLSPAGRAGPEDGLGIAAPTALETVEAHEAAWAILAAAGSDSISVLRVDGDGNLTPVEHILDTTQTRFGAVQALSAIQVDGQVLVFAGGGDDGISVFALLPDGRLALLQSLENGPGLGLDDVTAIETMRSGDAVRVFVSGEGAAGVAEFSWDIGNLGAVVTGPEAGSGIVQGGAGDDLLVDAGGGGILRGAAGNDILVAGDATQVLDGGSGADLFVLRPAIAPVRIVGFEPGPDRLDLTAFPMLRAPGQLAAMPLETGLRLEYRGSVIEIETASGTGLALSDLWPAGIFETPDRALYAATPQPLVIEGTAAADSLTGGAGRDMIRAYGGDDTLRGGAGDDTLQGGLGNDTLIGGDADDLLDGGADNDRIEGLQGNNTVFGGAGDDYVETRLGNDRIFGGTGNDTLFASGGNDTIGGAAGNDFIGAGAGADQAWGGGGNDTVFGAGGNDNISGAGGNDNLWGGGGNDTVFASAGNDRSSGAAGDDELWSGDGDDESFGAAGSDTLYGGKGLDTLWGGSGNDTLRGGADNDLLYGVSGADLLDGGAGNDTMTGGVDADTFVFSAGLDVVTDFGAGDVVDLSGVAGIADFADLQANFLSPPGGPDAVISDGLGNTLTLTGIDSATLDAGDFIF